MLLLVWRQGAPSLCLCFSGVLVVLLGSVLLCVRVLLLLSVARQRARYVPLAHVPSLLVLLGRLLLAAV